MVNLETINDKKKLIKVLMLIKGVTVGQLAGQLGVTHVAVSRTVHGKCSSRRIKTAIAEAVGEPYEELWEKEKR